MAQLPCHLADIGYYPSGLPELRRAIADRYAARGLPTDPEQVIVTSGALSGLAMVIGALVRPGDRVLTESPSYPNALAALRRSGARLHGADIDQSGWATASLGDAVRQLRPTLAYLMPDWHNPTGLLMSDEQRTELAARLTAARTLTVVDETTAELAVDEPWTGRMPLPFAAHLPGAVTLGSASKTFWGGLRIGWVRAPHERVAELLHSRLTLDLGSPVVDQLALAHLMADHDAVLEVRREQLAASRAALVSGLADPPALLEVPGAGRRAEPVVRAAAARVLRAGHVGGRPGCPAGRRPPLRTRGRPRAVRPAALHPFGRAALRGDRAAGPGLAGDATGTTYARPAAPALVT